MHEFLKKSYCSDGHSSLGGEKSIKTYYILSEFFISKENWGTLDIEKRIFKDKLIVAKPDMWIVNGSRKAIEIESKVPQRRKIKNKSKRLKNNGADKIILAIAYNPDTEYRTIKQIKNKQLLRYCDEIILIDYTKFESFIKGEIIVEKLIKKYKEKEEKPQLVIPVSRR